MKKLMFSIALIMTASFAAAQEPGTVYRIKYISGENVYLDAGLADSLVVGDRLIVKQGDSTIAELEIAFAAEHSSSCKILTQSGTMAPGDLAIVSLRNVRPSDEVIQESVPLVEPSVETPVTQAKPIVKRPPTRVSGGVSLQLYKWNDTGISNLDFTQPSVRLNLKATRLWGADFSFSLRSTTRYNSRNRDYSPSVPKTEWRNRIYQLSFGYSDDKSPFGFEVGRVISNKISGIGYIDGLLIQKGLVGNLHLGAFGGTQPQWQYSGFQSSLQKYGAYLSIYSGAAKTNRLESSLALAGEYHGGTVSREFAYLRNSINLGGRWSIYQSAEVEINRGWRKEKTGESIAVSNLYLSARGRLTNYLSAGLSYDNRKNYWTFETRTVADSLFDDVMRRGVRADVSLRPARNYLIFSNFGYRKRSSDSEATYSYALGFNNTNFIFARQFINLQFAGFSNPFTDGYNYSIKLGRSFRGGDQVSLATGAYVYEFGISQAQRVNRWYQVSGQFDLISRVYSSATFEHATGDDTRGQRVVGEIGYRF